MDSNQPRNGQHVAVPDAPTKSKSTSATSLSERCKVGRLLASQWMTLAAAGNGPTQQQPSTAKQPPASHPSAPSFLEALKRPPGSQSPTVASSSMGTSPPDPPSASGPPKSGAHVSPLVPLDDCLHTAIVSILRDIAVSGATLPDAAVTTPVLTCSNALHRNASTGIKRNASPSSVLEGSMSDVSIPSTPPMRPTSSGDVGQTPNTRLTSRAPPNVKRSALHSTPPPLKASMALDPDLEHWRGIKQKFLHLRTQIRNRDEFDLGLTQLFGDEWSRAVEQGYVEDDTGGESPVDVEADSFAGCCDDLPSATALAATRQRAGSTSSRTNGTAPPSPICLQPPNSDDVTFATSPSACVQPSKLRTPGGSPPPPPTFEATAAASGSTRPGSSTPPLAPTAHRQSPPPTYSAMSSSNNNNAHSSPVASPASGRPVTYHLESRDEMLRRKNTPQASTGSLNASTSSNPYSSSVTGFPPGSATPLTTAAATSSPSAVSYPGGVGSSSTPKNRSLSNSPLIGPMVGAHVPGIGSPIASGLCPFDYIMVLDFEATCEEPTPPNFLHEIIEFPVVVVDVQLRRICMEFHSFVKPMVNPILSHFCKQLTGIQQEDVDCAPHLPEVIKRFESWYKASFPPTARVIFATDGPWDMRDFMYLHSHKRQGIQFPSVFYQWIDVKAAFANFFHAPRQRIVKMLEYLGLPLEGRLHSGLDDSRNIAKIVIGLLIRGCSLCDLDRLPYIGAPVSIDGAS